MLRGETCSSFVFRQNCVGNKSSASKFVEVLTRINIPVHLLQEVSSVNDAALSQTEGELEESSEDEAAGELAKRGLGKAADNRSESDWSCGLSQLR